MFTLIIQLRKYNQYHMFDMVCQLICYPTTWLITVSLKAHLYAILEEGEASKSVGWDLLVVKLTERLFGRMRIGNKII